MSAPPDLCLVPSPVVGRSNLLTVTQEQQSREEETYEETNQKDEEYVRSAHCKSYPSATSTSIGGATTPSADVSPMCWQSHHVDISSLKRRALHQWCHAATLQSFAARHE